MCGLIFHKEPSTGLHTLMALVSPLKSKGIPHALDRFHEWYVTLLLRGGGGGSSDYYRAYLGDIIWSISLIMCNKIYARVAQYYILRPFEIETA